MNEELTVDTRKVVFGMLCAVFALPAVAGHCPVDVKAIDAALAENPNLSETQLAEVKELRDQGEQLHNDGKHGESLDALHQAMEILGLEHGS